MVKKREKKVYECLKNLCKHLWWSVGFVYVTICMVSRLCLCEHLHWSMGSVYVSICGSLLAL